MWLATMKEANHTPVFFGEASATGVRARVGGRGPVPDYLGSAASSLYSGMSGESNWSWPLFSRELRMP